MAQVPVVRSGSGRGGNLTTRRRHHPLDLFRRHFDTLFDRMWNDWLIPFEPEFPQVQLWDFDVKENDNEIVVRAEAPGFDEKDLDVRLEDNLLTIRAEKESKGEKGEEYRSLYRTVMLPSGTDAEKVQASYRNGVLELHIPRPEGSRAKRIPVRGELTHEKPRATEPSKQSPGTSHQATGSHTAAASEHTTTQKGKA